MLLGPVHKTLIHHRRSIFPDAVSGGQDTVGVVFASRRPLTTCTGMMVRVAAAPSANKFGHVSPTKAGTRIEEFPDERQRTIASVLMVDKVRSVLVDDCRHEPSHQPWPGALRPWHITVKQPGKFCVTVNAPGSLHHAAWHLESAPCTEYTGRPGCG